jgi:hypothetical protein
MKSNPGKKREAIIDMAKSMIETKIAKGSGLQKRMTEIADYDIRVILVGFERETCELYREIPG